MENLQTIPYRRISFLFVLLLAVISWGFYKTYIIFFPSFTGFVFAQHFHGAMMMTWMIFLIVQPLLIRSGKIKIHRAIGKLSFLIAPLLVTSIFLVTRMVYFRPDSPSHQEKIAEIALPTPLMIAFAVFYILAIINRKNTTAHMRYMIGTSLLMIGPGLARALIIYYNYSSDASIIFCDLLSIGIAALLLLSDIIKRRPYIPYTIVLIGITLSYLIWEARYSAFWQNTGEFIAKNLF